MSTAIHTPCHSPASSQDFLSFHTCLQDMQDTSFAYPLSPCRQPSATPPRQQPLLLTPPLRRRADDNFDFDLSMQLDFDDFSAAAGVSTPFHQNKKFTSSPRPRRFKPEDDLPPFFRPPEPPSEEDEGLFLRSNIGHTSLPLRTPKRRAFDPIHAPNSVANFPHAPKRKINRLSSSPYSRRGLTPLHVHHVNQESEPLKRFATLAPLPAPRFVHELGSVGCNMGRHVDTLKEMRISDRSTGLDSDSGSEGGFSSLKVRRTTNRSVRASTGGMKDMTTSRSPDGHVNKRRPRSRPVSLEFTDVRTPVLSPKPKSKVRHRRKGSNTSVSDAGSPVKIMKAVEQARPVCDRRLASSATLFFGPAIVYPDDAKKSHRSPHALPPSTPVKTDEELNTTSPESSFTSAFPKPPDTSVQFSFTLTSEASSPRSRIPTKYKKTRDSGVVLSDDETEDMLEPVLGQSKLSRPDSLPRLHVRASTFPQPTANITTSSETTLFDDSFVTPSHEKSRESTKLASHVDISLVDDFIVKTLEAGTKDGAGDRRPPGTPQKRTRTAFLGLPILRPWASEAVEKMDRTPLFGEKLPAPDFGSVMDSGGSAGDLSVPRQMSRLNGRPRKSCPSDLRFPEDRVALTSSVMSLRSNGSTESDVETSPTDTRLINPRNRTYGDVGMGRPSAKFNASQFLLRRSSSGAFSTTSDGSDGSRTGTPTRGNLSKRKDNDFRVPLLSLKQLCTPSTKSPHLMPLSPISPSAVNHNRETPGARPSGRSQFSIFGKHMKENRKPESFGGSSSFSGITERGATSNYSTPHPLKNEQLLQQGGRCESFLDTSQTRGKLGRFEREFVEVDKIGSGEFGSAIKVRFKREDQEGCVYAVKKSKRFEGNRHRSRLREEVEILQHLSACAGPEFHPNVLGYVDSWEQDDRLYILTDLCEFGNFAHFLDEYGHHFQRLDEARVWKIFADISSGLRFVHMVNVVHFDLKPANVFITAAGRFKIGDFGMASFWPRPADAALQMGANDFGRDIDFEREGDKMYLAAEVLQGRYGKETDIFSFGMMMLETATNIYVPAQGDPWHRLREQDFSQVEGFSECSGTLQQLIMSMMSKDPAARPTAEEIFSHSVISRARVRMKALLDDLAARGEPRPEILFKASPLAGVDDSFLPDILGEDVSPDMMEMDCNV